jgi:BirA family biotin operon repressor/biotin-[acetyl-CoA-carboxylase] ligase
VPSAHFNLARIRSQIKPFRLYWFTHLKSTNDHAALLRRRRELFAPAIVLTGRQIKGRGRGSNSWWSASGSLTATFVLPIQDHLLPQQIPLVAGLIVRNVLADLVNDQKIQLKWPNDILHDDRKLAGVLCERIEKADLIGVGINANVVVRGAPPALRNRITSLAAIAKRHIDLNQLVIDLANGFSRIISRREERPFAQVLREYDRHHALRGRRVTVQPVGEENIVSGTCFGLDSAGRLLLRSGGHSFRVIAGNVHLHVR